MESIIHLDAAEAALRLDRDTLIMLLDTFFTTREDYTKPLHDALEGIDRSLLKSEAHRLKGASNNLRIEGIGALALELEQCVADPDKTQEDISRVVKQIEEAFNQGEIELVQLKKEPGTK